MVQARGVQHTAHLTSLWGPFYNCQVLLHFLKGKEKFFEGGKFSWDGEKFIVVDRLLSFDKHMGKKWGSQKRSSKKFKENEVKYIEFAMSNFAALLTMVTKILAQWCSCVGHPWFRVWVRVWVRVWI